VLRKSAHGAKISRVSRNGLNTDRIQAGKELVPESYGDGGTRAMALEHGEITEQIIGAAFEVYSILGYGFLEKVYQRSESFRLAACGCMFTGVSLSVSTNPRNLRAVRRFSKHL
jgi:hypothetical protein